MNDRKGKEKKSGYILDPIKSEADEQKALSIMESHGDKCYYVVTHIYNVTDEYGHTETFQLEEETQKRTMEFCKNHNLKFEVQDWEFEFSPGMYGWDLKLPFMTRVRYFLFPDKHQKRRSEFYDRYSWPKEHRDKLDAHYRAMNVVRWWEFPRYLYWWLSIDIKTIIKKKLKWRH